MSEVERTTTFTIDAETPEEAAAIVKAERERLHGREVRVIKMECVDEEEA